MSDDEVKCGKTPENTLKVAARWRRFYSRGMKLGGCPLSDFSLRTIARYMERGSRVLDAGYGTGRAIRHMLAMPELLGRGIDVTGLDFCMEALLSVDGGAGRVCGSILSIPFIPECFDVIIARQVLDGYSRSDISRISACLFNMLTENGILTLDTRGPMDTRNGSLTVNGKCGIGSQASFVSRAELVSLFAPFDAVDWEEAFRRRTTPSGEKLITHNISVIFRKGKAVQP